MKPDRAGNPGIDDIDDELTADDDGDGDDDGASDPFGDAMVDFDQAAYRELDDAPSKPRLRQVLTPTGTVLTWTKPGQE